MTAPTRAASAASAQYLRWRRRSSRRASSINASRASISSRSSGLLSRASGACEGGRGGAETVMPASTSNIELVLLVH